MDLLFEGRFLKEVVKKFSGVRVLGIIKRSKSEGDGNKKRCTRRYTVSNRLYK